MRIDIHPTRRLRTTLASLIILSSAAGCAAPERPTDGSAAFTTQPATAQPAFAFLWRDQVTSWDYLGVEPKEFAVPAHVGPTDEVVVATSEGEVVKYQAANGSLRWRHRVDGAIHAGATVGSNHAFVATLEGGVYALDLQSGEPRWNVQRDHSFESQGAYAEGRLFLSDAADVLHAFDAETGEDLWSYGRNLPEYFTVKGSCTPVIDRDAVYCGFSDGFLAALQIDTGELLWEIDLSGGADNFADVDGAVIIAGNRIFAASYAGGVYALERSSGTPIWRAEVSSIADITRRDDTLFVASALGRVVAIDAEDGTAQWGFKMSKTIPGSIATFGPYVLAFTTEGPVYVLDGDTGYPHMKWRGTSGFLAPVGNGSSRLYAISNHGQVFGLKLGY